MATRWLLQTFVTIFPSIYASSTCSSFVQQLGWTFSFAHVSMPNDCASNESVFCFFPPTEHFFFFFSLPWLCSRCCVNSALMYGCACQSACLCCVCCLFCHSKPGCVFCLPSTVVSLGNSFLHIFTSSLAVAKSKVGVSCSVLRKSHLNTFLRLLRYLTRV